MGFRRESKAEGGLSEVAKFKFCQKKGGTKGGRGIERTMDGLEKKR